ncbi:hypothetical protein AVEN_72356-1 [Araneus ventricosus]|uniref:Uncharacterized protein n=1 Tax=Araneus ventricosus TaxID=182803 RepID=A0A4Y2SNG9_ARAVE|nr:hypothetical protein AVEN_72356-1 [Araneus ventricosus]
MCLGPETLKQIICLWHGMLQEKREEGHGGRHELCSGMKNAGGGWLLMYVLICWTPEVVRKREAALGGRVNRRARFSTAAVVRVFSESEEIGWEGPVSCMGFSTW